MKTSFSISYFGSFGPIKKKFSLSQQRKDWETKKMLWIDIENKRIGGTAKVADIKKYGLIKASQLKYGGDKYEEKRKY